MNCAHVDTWLHSWDITVHSGPIALSSMGLTTRQKELMLKVTDLQYFLWSKVFKNGVGEGGRVGYKIYNFDECSEQIARLLKE
jgi:hypothetical protein